MAKGSGWMRYGHQKAHVRCCRWCLGMAKPVGERRQVRGSGNYQCGEDVLEGGGVTWDQRADLLVSVKDFSPASSSPR